MTTMKRILTIICALIATCVLGACQKEYDPHPDYTPSSFCSSESSSLHSSKAKVINVCATSQTKISNHNNSHSSNPFDTLIYLRYDASITTQELTQMENIIGNTLIRLHKIADRNYYYTDDNSEFLINNIKVVNDSYGTNRVIENVDDDLLNMLEMALESTKKGNNRFNPFVGELSDYWDSIIDDSDHFNDPLNTDNPNRETSLDKINELVSNIPTYEEIIENKILEIDRVHKTVKFNKFKNVDKLSLTLGGIAKGYAIDALAKNLIAAGFNKGLINGGTSSLESLGDATFTDAWYIAPQNPNTFNNYYNFDADKNYIGNVKLNGVFNVSTSGDVERGYYFINPNDPTVIRRRHHIVNTDTGIPNNYYRTVTLFSSDIDAGYLDAYSTIVFNMPFDEAKTFIKKIRETNDLHAIFIQENVQDINSVLIDQELYQHYTNNQNLNLQVETYEV